MSRIPYGPSDDAAADRFINVMVRQPDPRVWAELCGEVYAEQTDRVLRHFVDATVVALTKRKGDLDVALARRVAREITKADYAALVADYGEWRTRTLHFQALAKQYIRQTRPVVARMQNFEMVDALRDAVRTLTRAIADHRDTVIGEDFEPTSADRMLWARLATVQVPTKSPSDLVSAGDHIGVAALASSSRGAETPNE